jgi:tetratricopeptide (TPR) repeat protein
MGLEEELTMSCLLCGDETTGGDAVCTSCAYSSLRDEWYAAEEEDGYFRLRAAGQLAAVLSDGELILTKGVDTADEFISSLPDTVEGYREAIALMTGILDHTGIGRKEHFVLPAFGHVSALLERLGRYEEMFPHTADETFYRNMSSLYTAAASLFYLPLVPEGFSESRKRALAQKASYWESRCSAGAPVFPQIPAAEIREDTGGATAAEHAEMPARSGPVELLPKVEMLKSRIRSMELAISRVQEMTRPANADASGPDQTEGRGSAVGAEEAAAEGVLLGKRAKVDLLTGHYQDALSNYMRRIERFPPDGDDLAGAVAAALRLREPEKAQEAAEMCMQRGMTVNVDLVRSFLAWREGRWGMALQLADSEIENAGSSAAFILKLNICAQYGLTDREKELKMQQRMVHDFPSGAGLISSFYLGLDMWGAALQCINHMKREEWTDDTFSVLGQALEEKGDIEGALNAYDDALRINGHNSTALIRKGLMMSRNGSHADALRLFREDELLWPANAWLAVAELRHLNRGAEGIELIKSALSEDRTNLKLAKAGLALAAELRNARERRYFSMLIREAGLA